MRRTRPRRARARTLRVCMYTCIGVHVCVKTQGRTNSATLSPPPANHQEGCRGLPVGAPPKPTWKPSPPRDGWRKVGAFGRSSGQKGGATLDGISALMRRDGSELPSQCTRPTEGHVRTQPGGGPQNLIVLAPPNPRHLRSCVCQPPELGAISAGCLRCPVWYSIVAAPADGHKGCEVSVARSPTVQPPEQPENGACRDTPLWPSCPPPLLGPNSFSLIHF